jgi:L-phenylalanine/L-methionine N-acetyltransferase
MTIIIRRAEPNDYADIANILTFPRVVWGTLQVPYPSVEQWRKKLAEPLEGLYSLVACAEGDVIGLIGLHTNPNQPRRRHIGGIGMMVRDDWQGKGIGTQLMQAAIDLADKWLNLSRLELSVYPDNEPAVKLYKRFGFQIEGTQVCAAFRDGCYVDTLMMARIRLPRPQGL